MRLLFTHEEESRINDFIEEQKRLCLFESGGEERWYYEVEPSSGGCQVTLRDRFTGNCRIVSSKSYSLPLDFFVTEMAEGA